jgi:hypothetical protein
MHNSEIDSNFQQLFLLKYPLGPHFNDGHLTPVYDRVFRETEKPHSFKDMLLAKEEYGQNITESLYILAEVT